MSGHGAMADAVCLTGGMTLSRYEEVLEPFQETGPLPDLSKQHYLLRLSLLSRNDWVAVTFHPGA